MIIIELSLNQLNLTENNTLISQSLIQIVIGFSIMCLSFHRIRTPGIPMANTWLWIHEIFHNLASLSIYIYGIVGIYNIMRSNKLEISEYYWSREVSILMYKKSQSLVS